MGEIFLYDDCVMLAYNKEVRENCLPFSCGEDDLDDFFLNDADLYAEELLGKTYCWVTTEAPDGGSRNSVGIYFSKSLIIPTFALWKRINWKC